MVCLHVWLRRCRLGGVGFQTNYCASQEEPAEEQYSDADYANYYWEQQNEWRERMEREEAERQARREEAFQRRREKERAAQVNQGRHHQVVSHNNSWYILLHYSHTHIYRAW